MTGVQTCALPISVCYRYHSPRIRTTLVCPGHVRTPLFSTAAFPKNVLFRFFLPSLAPVTVAKAIIAALDAHESRSIHLPFYTYSALIMRLLPSFFRDLAQKVSLDKIGVGPSDAPTAQLTRADFIMDDFTKVTGIREDEIGSSQNKKVV